MKTAYAKYIFALLLFGSNGIVASRISLTSYEIVFWRTMIGGALLIALFLCSGGRWTFSRYPRSLGFIIGSGIATGCSWIFLYEAYARIGVSLASLAYYCGPVIVMVLSPLLFKEKMTAPKLLGFGAVLAGVVLANNLAGGLGATAPDSWGLTCGFLSALAYSLMVMLNKKAVDIRGLENSALQLTVSFLTVAVLTGLKTGFQLQVPAGDWPWIFLLGLVNTGLGCYFYFSSIGGLPVQSVAVCGYLEPLSAVVLALLLLGEKMTVLQILGAALIVGGALFGECVKGRRQPT